MSFDARFRKLNWDDVSLSIRSKTQEDVEAALRKPNRSLEDFKALISPAAESYIEEMAQISAAITKQRFGNTMSFYIPLYLSNLCANACTYCGFSMENRIKRRTLSKADIEAEVTALKKMKFDSILLVTGEHESKVGMDYFREVLPLIKKQFSYLAMEVQPLNQHDYKELNTLGLDAVMVYQETYHEETYSEHHLRGNKRDFNYRLETPDRLGKAGVDKIGIGALLGLQDWRTDSFYVASHLDYLERTYWRSRYSVSFPRLRPCAGGVTPKSLMSDRQLLQLICAYRLLNPEVELSLSTRESPHFRDNVARLGVTTMSAGSVTQPGGYATDVPELEQFSTSDERTPEEVATALQERGVTVVWKDWDRAYSGKDCFT